jgi:hypothetical protein
MKIQFTKSKTTIGPAQSVGAAQQPWPAPAPARACADRSAPLVSDSTQGRELRPAYLAAGDPPTEMNAPTYSPCQPASRHPTFPNSTALELPRRRSWRTAEVGCRAPVISGDPERQDSEGKGSASDGREDEVLKRDGGATERLDHVHRAAAAHRALRRGQCSGRSTKRYGAT